MKTNIKVVLVNLISWDYLARYQAPLSVSVLASYFRAVLPGIEVSTIDMQDIFAEYNNQTGTVSEVYSNTIDFIIERLVSICSEGKTIIGLSIKWSTQEIAGQIIRRVRQKLSSNQPLFIVGNIAATHGYKDLLTQDDFSNVIAVIGEGEKALVEIAKIASQTTGDFIDTTKYIGVSNVAINHNNSIHTGEVRRLDLASYPVSANSLPSDIYDQEWDVYAIETSRGCPWGSCTFCSIKKQFGAKDQMDDSDFDWYWRGFSIDKILSDISYFAKQGVRRFDIKDSEFFGPSRTTKAFSATMDRITNFANRLIALNGELRDVESQVRNDTITITHISARVDTIYSENPLEKEKNVIRKKVYALLKAAGLRRVYLGIESGSATQLKRYRKGVSVNENTHAIAILRELGLEIEVGFIFFDYLATLEELKQNISFIESSKIHETDSRILGSLRIQKGSPYVAIAEKCNILGSEENNQLSYNATFVNKDVAEIESLFSRWEKSTRKLVKIIPSHLRIESYKMDFAFIKDVIACYEAGRKDWLITTVEAHSAVRANFLTKVKQDFDNGFFGRRLSKLFLEYLLDANNQNALLIKEVIYAERNGSN